MAGRSDLSRMVSYTFELHRSNLHEQSTTRLPNSSTQQTILEIAGLVRSCESELNARMPRQPRPDELVTGLTRLLQGWYGTCMVTNPSAHSTVTRVEPHWQAPVLGPADRGHPRSRPPLLLSSISLPASCSMQECSTPAGEGRGESSPGCHSDAVCCTAGPASQATRARENWLE